MVDIFQLSKIGEGTVEGSGRLLESVSQECASLKYLITISTFSILHWLLQEKYKKVEKCWTKHDVTEFVKVKFGWCWMCCMQQCNYKIHCYVLNMYNCNDSNVYLTCTIQELHFTKVTTYSPPSQPYCPIFCSLRRLINHVFHTMQHENFLRYWQ